MTWNIWHHWKITVIYFWNQSSIKAIRCKFCSLRHLDDWPTERKERNLSFDHFFIAFSFNFQHFLLFGWILRYGYTFYYCSSFQNDRELRWAIFKKSGTVCAALLPFKSVSGQFGENIISKNVSVIWRAVMWNLSWTPTI